MAQSDPAFGWLNVPAATRSTEAKHALTLLLPERQNIEPEPYGRTYYSSGIRYPDVSESTRG